LIITSVPVVVKCATNAAAFVPYGTVKEMVFALSLILAVAGGLLNEKAVIAFSLDRGGLGVGPLEPSLLTPLPPQD
jgi:hypothetical protein